MPRFTDNFNRANGALGSNWTSIAASTLEISSNVVALITGSGEYCYRDNTGNTYANDQDSQVVMTARVNSSYIGAAVRCANSAATYYFGYIAYGGDWYLGRFVNGTYTEIASGASVPNIGDIYMIDVVGTTVRFRRDRGGTVTTLGSGTDSTLSSGRPGVSAGGIAGSTFDDYAGGDNVGAGATSPVAVRSGRQVYASLLTW